MTLTRRKGLGFGLAAVLGGLVRPRRALGQSLDEALMESDLIYLTPLRGDGAESRCQAEIWFVYDGVDLFVVTAMASWRARAVRNGLWRARIWVGDLGNWQRANGAYRDLPTLEARATIVEEQQTRERILALYAEKYPLSWIRWGPKFRAGLADGSRVLLRYQRVS